MPIELKNIPDLRIWQGRPETVGLGDSLQDVLVVGIYLDDYAVCYKTRRFLNCYRCPLVGLCPNPAVVGGRQTKKSIPREEVLKYVRPINAIGKALNKKI